MKFVSLTTLFAVGLSAVASSQSFSVSGPGGSVPDRPFISFPLWNEAPDWPAFTSPVDVTDPVASITHVVLSGFNHDSKYQVHAFISDPNGVRYNVIVRPGFQSSNSDNGDFLSGNYDIVESGGTSSYDCCGNDISGGLYDQYLNPPFGGWTNTTTFPINNTPLNSITGPAGTWTLTIYDWDTDQIGLLPSAIAGWTLQGISLIGPQPPVVICEPGLNGIIACPCGNPPSGPGRGCDNSALTGGATLSAAGTASISADTLVFTTTDERPTSLSIVLQGNEQLATGAPFGDGVRCVGENLRRLYTKSAVGGSIVAPSGSDPTVSARSAALGVPILAGTERRYQVYYRDPELFACPSPGGSRFNITDGLRVPWVN